MVCLLNTRREGGEKYPIVGVKAKDCRDWMKVAELMKEKNIWRKKAPFGEQIRNIKAGMNTGRKIKAAQIKKKSKQEIAKL